MKHSIKKENHQSLQQKRVDCFIKNVEAKTFAAKRPDGRYRKRTLRCFGKSPSQNRPVAIVIFILFL